VSPTPAIVRWLAAPLALAAAGLSWAPAADDPKFAPRTFALQAATITLDKAVEELQKQTDIAVDLTRAEPARSFRLDCPRVPFWEALERIARASDHRVAFSEAGRKIHLVGGAEAAYRQLPLSVDGPFRLVVKRVMALTDLEQDRNYYEVQMELHWEPHYSVFLVEPPSANVTAKDNNDRDLPVADAGRGRTPTSGGGTQLALRLQDVPRASRTIKLIQGQVSAVGSAALLRFEMPAPGATEQSQTKDGVTVKVRTDFKEGSDLWAAYVAIEYPEGGPMLESFESAAWLADVRASLVSADGKRRLDVNGGEELVTQTDRTARVNYRWVPDDTTTTLGKPADWKLVVQTPGRFVEVPVRFKLENIPLP
jgi:hypothetical protein